MAQLWVEPSDARAPNIRRGPASSASAPKLNSTFTFKARDTSGKSPGYDVVDAKGIEWSVKLGKEAQTEVVASRILWVLGYHQPPTYYLDAWTLEGAGADSGPKSPARFRPELTGARVIGDWSWHQNPFVGTREFRGLIIANLLINNWDMKTSQNKIYEFDRSVAGAERWYVVRDLGASFGKPRWPTGTKNDVDDFEEHGFIRQVDRGRIEFQYYGRHSELFRDITTADMRWVCSRLSRLTAEQWREAFHAGGYDAATSDRYVRKLRQKINEGLEAAGMSESLLPDPYRRYGSGLTDPVSRLLLHRAGA